MSETGPPLTKPVAMVLEIASHVAVSETHALSMDIELNRLSSCSGSTTSADRGRDPPSSTPFACLSMLERVFTFNAAILDIVDLKVMIYQDDQYCGKGEMLG